MMSYSFKFKLKPFVIPIFKKIVFKSANKIGNWLKFQTFLAFDKNNLIF